MPVDILDAFKRPQRINAVDDLVSLFGAKTDPADPNTGIEQVTLVSIFKQMSLYMKVLHDNGVTSQPVLPVAGENHFGEVGGSSIAPSNTLATPDGGTVTYATGQLIAQATPAAVMVPVARKNGGSGLITGIRLLKSGTSINNAQFRVHMFQTAPGITATDGTSIAGGIAGFAAGPMGYVDIIMDQVYSDGAAGFAAIGSKVFKTAPTVQTLAVVLEARGAYTRDSAEVFTFVPEVMQD